MTNTNCLEGIRCPQCGNEDRFRIAAQTIATVTDDGTDDVGDMEWDDDSHAECTECHHRGTLKDFRAIAAGEADAAGYFLGGSGKRYAYAEIAARIRKEAPHTLGKHISVQLQAIGLLDELEKGCTPCGLPVTFAEGDGEAAAEHTPGPWQQDWQFIVAPDPTGFHQNIYIVEIAEEDEEGRIASPGQQAANGRLIVAAPELLVACRMVVERWERGDLAEAARTCQAAVTLATDGRPPWNIADGALKPYSVLLLYPDYANDDGKETYYAWVEASDSTEAVAAARRQAVAANDCVEIDPEDFAPLLVTKGHHYG